MLKSPLIKKVKRSDDSSAEAFCIIVTTIEIFEFVESLFERGDPIPAEVDGTYRLTDIG